MNLHRFRNYANMVESARQEWSAVFGDEVAAKIDEWFQKFLKETPLSTKHALHAAVSWHNTSELIKEEEGEATMFEYQTLALALPGIPHITLRTMYHSSRSG